MTGYTALTNRTYVAAYQAELRSDLRDAGSSRGKLQAKQTLAERWQARTGPRRATNRMVSATQMR